MTDRGNNSGNCRDTSCINVNRVYDCCKDRDCIMDMRVYIPQSSQSIVDRAVNVKASYAEVLWTYIDVEPLQFNKGFYTIDIRFFFRVVLDIFTGVGRPVQIDGLCTYDKRVVLFGSEGGAKLFSSLYVPRSSDVELTMRSNLPKATVETVDPVVLSAKLVDSQEPFGCGCIDVSTIPEYVCNCFDSNITDTSVGNNIYVTLGLFSVVRLMREVQIVVPSTEFCVPEKECCGPTEDDPCNLFYRMSFPVNEFFPPKMDPCTDRSPCDAPSCQEPDPCRPPRRNCGN